jgi:hypothetical protein
MNNTLGAILKNILPLGVFVCQTHSKNATPFRIWYYIIDDTHFWTPFSALDQLSYSEAV